ncbi:acyl-CoA dehydrogenase family protein [Mammaliicoccus sciuri]
MKTKELVTNMTEIHTDFRTSETSDELVARAVSLQPLLKEHAKDVDKSRSISSEVIEKIAESGLLNLGVPKRYGGQEEPLQTQLRVSAALGKGCSSTAWVVQNINAASVLVSTFSKQAQDEVWGVNQSARVAGAQSMDPGVRVEGGWELSGRWGWMSGVEQADWAFITFLKADGSDSPDLGIALVPLSSGKVKDTWKVVGMRGTASNTLELDKVFVPDHRVVSASDTFAGKTATEYQDETLYHVSMSIQLFLILTGSIIGMAEAALDHVIEGSAKKGIAYTVFQSQRESTGFQLQIAEAALMIKSARLHIFRAAAEVDNSAERGVQMDYPTRARLRAEGAYAVKLLRDAVDILVDSHGAATFAEGNPLQRIWRDINTAARHGQLVSQMNYEIFGKFLLESEESIHTLL